jgi:hypothetical protein
MPKELFRHGVWGTQGLDQKEYPMCPLAVGHKVQSNFPGMEGMKLTVRGH